MKWPEVRRRAALATCAGHNIAARNQIAQLTQRFGILIDHQVEEAAGEK
jgi:hypothetical protein